MHQKTLVLFDFDGTLTRGDSLLPFLTFALSPAKLGFGIIRFAIRVFGLGLTGNLNNERAKEALLAACFKGMDAHALQTLGTEFHARKLPRMLRPAMLEKLREYRKTGATVVLVSASPDVWLKPFCSAENLRLLCTRLDFENGRFTGKLAGSNCNGPEKARRVKEGFNLSEFDRIIAFGNSKGDAAMLELADEGWLLCKDALIKVS